VETGFSTGPFTGPRRVSSILYVPVPAPAALLAGLLVRLQEGIATRLSMAAVQTIALFNAFIR
jgi:hypothetical protein